jgi:hypothetical protein
MDRAVSKLDFRALAGKTVYLDSAALNSYTDSDYLVSLLRQHMLASGCLFRDSKTEAEYIVEARAGAIGTDRSDVMFGVPAVNVPSMLPLNGIPPQIPEMPLVKKTDQRAVTKLAVFAYNRETGRPVWQSGTIPMESTAKDVWVLGAGPFQRGTIYEGTVFAGDQLKLPLIDPGNDRDTDHVSVADEAYFIEPGEREMLAETEDKASPGAPPAQNDGSSANPEKPSTEVLQAKHEDSSNQTPKQPAAVPKNAASEKPAVAAAPVTQPPSEQPSPGPVTGNASPAPAPPATLPATQEEQASAMKKP